MTPSPWDGKSSAIGHSAYRADEARSRDVRSVLWMVLVLNLLVAFAKLLYGAMTGSLGMQADGFHSLFDGVSNVVGLIGLWLASAPPDDQHPYGHKKYETLAAAVIGAMLVATCLYLLWNSYLHWQSAIRPEVTGVSFAVMLVTMGINYGVMRWERARGEALRSEILLADSRHTGSDILTSVSVLVGLAAVRLGYPIVDPIVAVVIAVIIARTAATVLFETSRSLTDMARLDPAEVRSVVLQNQGILDCHEIRTRGLPHHIFVDLSVHVNASMTVGESHELAHRVEQTIMDRFEGVAEVIVHVEPDPCREVGHAGR
ncbi:MAG TPA: cation diffusion facilitator family transporter [Nitrospiraceae bacterium]|jgi:cation diffusion facilitator family transporter|nr:cation diffusion facilitator family transporter [Nitrospiraceae bacterium]